MRYSRPMGVSETSTARELLQAYRSKAVSPVEITRAALARVERLNPALNFLYIVDAEGAMDAARASERRWMAGTPIGLLDGVPTTAKDALPTRGFPTYRGAAVHNRKGEKSTDDAPAIARQKEHGAVILGKTTMPDFGLLGSGYSSKHGVTRNPWNPAFNSAGSSSGACVSVAAGASPFVFGTDIVGSIRLPAAFCGLVGLKPTRGRVPYYFPNSPALVGGPIARTVEDAALLMDAITQPDARDFTALPRDGVEFRHGLDVPPAGKRLRLLEAIGFGPAPDPEVVAAMRAAARVFEGMGCTVEEIHSPFESDAYVPAENYYRVRVLTEMLLVEPQLRSESKVIDEWTQEAAGYSAADLYNLEAAMLRLAEQAAALLGDADYLLMPTSPIPPYEAELPWPKGSNLFGPWCNTFLFNLADLPAISFNCGFTRSGLPIGLQVVGRRLDDLGLLRMARQHERATSADVAWPFQGLLSARTSRP